MKRGLLLAACALALAACPKGPDPVDGGSDAGPVSGPCVDRPGELAKAPNGQLPCELLPPGFKP